MHTGERPVKMKADTGWGWGTGDVATSPGTPANHQELRETHGTEPLTAFGKKQPCPHLDVGLPASRTMRPRNSV